MIIFYLIVRAGQQSYDTRACKPMRLLKYALCCRFPYTYPRAKFKFRRRKKRHPNIACLQTLNNDSTDTDCKYVVVESAIACINAGSNKLKLRNSPESRQIYK